MLFRGSVGLCLCFLPSSAMYRDKAVGNVVAEMGRDLVFMTTARLSDLSMPLKGEVRRSTWTVCTAADCEERQICTTCLFAESIGLGKVDGLVCWSTRLFDLRGVVRGRGEIWRGSPQWNTKPPAKTTNSNSCDRAAAQVKEHKPEQPGWKYSKYWANIEKRNLKTIGNRKGDCAWNCSRWQTQPEIICKLQSTNQYNVRSEWHWFVRCDLQIFSGCVCRLEQLHAQSPFLFPIVFSINAFPVEHTSVWEGIWGIRGRGEIWRGNPAVKHQNHLRKPQTATVATAQRPK